MKFKPANVDPPDLDMTPMIDIVFQLITFFMVINKFEQNEADERVTLPRDQLAAPPAVQRKNAFLLNFGYQRNADGSLASPTPVFFFGDEKLTLDQVRPRLIQESQFYTAIGTDLADVTVEIRGDAEVQSGMVQELIQMCQENGIGFQRFALKAVQKADGF
jgi:biopolymer transport protein ExbD